MARSHQQRSKGKKKKNWEYKYQVWKNTSSKEISQEQFWGVFKSSKVAYQTDQKWAGHCSKHFAHSTTLSDPKANFVKLKNGNLGTSKTSSDVPSLLPESEDKTAARRERRAHGSLGQRAGKVNLWWVRLFVKRWGLTLKYSGWQWMGDWPRALISATHWGHWG